MANKNRYYGIVTKEQKESKERAKNSPFINKEELTKNTVYSAMFLVPNIDNLSVHNAVIRLKEALIKSGFTGKLTISGSSIADEYNVYVLTNSKKQGLHIVKETHTDIKRKKG